MGVSNTFYINDILMSDYKIYIGSDRKGLLTESFLPQLKHNTSSVIGVDGEYLYDSQLPARDISIPCYIDPDEGITEYEKLQIQNILFAKYPKKLILDNEPWKYLWVVSNNKIDWNIVQYGDGNYRGLFTIDYIAYDPLWYSYFMPIEYELNSNNIYDFHSIFNNVGILPSDIPTCIHNISANKTLYLNNHGTYETKLQISLNGSCSNLVIRNNTTGQSLMIDSMTNESVFIDGKRHMITNASVINGKTQNENALKTSKFSGDFITLLPGLNQIAISGDSLNVQIQFLYHFAYL